MNAIKCRRCNVPLTKENTRKQGFYKGVQRRTSYCKSCCSFLEHHYRGGTRELVEKVSNVDIIEGEVWSQCKGYGGMYFVSNMGRIKSIHTKSVLFNEYLIKPIMGSDYLVVNLFYNGIQKQHTIHTLVAKSFCKNKNRRKFVNHKDGDKLNNKSNNLEWVTHFENCTHAKVIGLTPSGGESHRAKLTNKEAIEIYTSPLSHKELSKMYGVSRRNINMIKNVQTFKNTIKEYIYSRRVG